MMTTTSMRAMRSSRPHLIRKGEIRWRDVLTWNLARHAISEELTVHPAMEKWLGEEGEALTKDDFTQHQAVCPPLGFSDVRDAQLLQVKNDLHTLISLSPMDLKFSALLDHFMLDLQTYIEHKSLENMPRLEAVIAKEESERIAKSFAGRSSLREPRAVRMRPRAWTCGRLGGTPGCAH